MMTKIENVILVDEHDQSIGEEEKQKAHELALCHRAFSVFVFRHLADKTEVLLQQRQLDKYHCGGLWTNTACGHPRPNETVVQAGERRLKEEMGFAVALKEVGIFHYVAQFDNGLTENEIDHVLVGFYDNESIQPDAAEVADYAWIDLEQLKLDVEKNASQYTPWFMLAFEQIEASGLL